MKRLMRYAQNGFLLYEGKEKPIRHEWDGVYRIGHPVDLFRILGFYEDDTKTNFIVIDAWMKGGQRLSASEQARIDAIATVKKNGLWRRKTNGKENDDYPKLAEGSGGF